MEITQARCFACSGRPVVDDLKVDSLVFLVDDRHKSLALLLETVYMVKCAQRAAHQPPRARCTRMRQNSDDLAREAVGLHAHVRRQQRDSRFSEIGSSVLHWRLNPVDVLYCAKPLPKPEA